MHNVPKNSQQDSVSMLACIDDNEDNDQLRDKMKSFPFEDVLHEDVLLAFSHWTYMYTKKEVLVCDLQGMLSEDNKPLRFRLTDPAIHTRKGQPYGPTDHGHKGQHNFFQTHICSPFCEYLGIKKWRKQNTGKDRTRSK